MTTLETKERILDAAEELFAESGFAATSLRAITSAADVNLAAVHYHFGSKLALFGAVAARRIRPVNERRLALLDALEARGEAELGEVLEAFVAPAIELLADPDSARFVRLMGRMNTETGEHWNAILEEFEEVRRRFFETLGPLLPHLGLAELAWRMNFTIGVMASVMANCHRVERLSGGHCDPADTERILDQMIPFLAAGLRADGARRPLEAETREGGRR